MHKGKAEEVNTFDSPSMQGDFQQDFVEALLAQQQCTYLPR
jgi:hypothetical protein